MRTRSVPRGLGLIVLGLILLGFALFTQLARNPKSALGRSRFGTWAQVKCPVPTRPTRITDNGAQLIVYTFIAVCFSIGGGITAMIRGNNGGWDL